MKEHWRMWGPSVKEGIKCRKSMRGG